MHIKFFSTFMLGLCDSFNVYNLSCLVIILILNDFFVFLRQSRTRSFFYTLLIVLWIGTLLSAVGLIDLLLAQPLMTVCVRYITLSIAAAFCILGILNLSDWRVYAKTKEAAQFKVWPFFPPVNFGKLLKRRALILLSVFCGILLAMLGSLWPQDYFLFIFNYENMVGQNWVKALASFLAYGFGLIFPMAIIYEFWREIIFSPPVRYLSLIKVFWAGLLMAVSFSIVFILFFR